MRLLLTVGYSSDIKPCLQYWRDGLLDWKVQPRRVVVITPKVTLWLDTALIIVFSEQLKLTYSRPRHFCQTTKCVDGADLNAAPKCRPCGTRVQTLPEYQTFAPLLIKRTGQLGRCFFVCPRSLPQTQPVSYRAFFRHFSLPAIQACQAEWISRHKTGINK